MNLDFGVNTDSFFGICFGLIDNDDMAGLKTKFSEFLDLLALYGIKTVEINTEIEQLRPGSLREIIIPMFNSVPCVTLTIHLPYLQLNPASPVEEYRTVSVDSIIRIVHACKGVPLKKFVVHLTSEFEDSISFFPVEDETKISLTLMASAQARKSILEIIAGTGLDPQFFAIENLEAFPFEYLYPTVEETGASVCFDMGHWGLNGFMPMDFIDKFGMESIGEIHIQDMSEKRIDLRTTIRNEHIPLGRGMLKPAVFFEYLASRDFSGPLIIENRSKKDLVLSLGYLKSTGMLR